MARGQRFDEITTQRLILRRWRESDRGPFAALNGDRETMRYFPAALSRAESDALADRIEALFEEQGYGLWALEVRADGRFIGFTGLNPMPAGVPGRRPGQERLVVWGARPRSLGAPGRGTASRAASTGGGMASGADAQSPGGRTWACRAPGAGQEPPPLAAGLSSEQAAARLAVDGANVLPAPRAVALWRRIAAQLRDPMILVLLAAAALTLATGDWTDASVIGLVIVVNTSVGVGQEVRADRAIAALSRLTAPEARVLRDGGQRQVPAAEVVVGDVLILAEGDIVPADAMVTEAAALLIDESALTGESVPVSKQAAPRAAPAGPGGGRRPEGQAGPAGQPEATVAAGTVVVRGRGRAVVTATGPASAMGRIAALMTARPALTPLQRRMAGLGRVLAVAAVVLCAIVMAVGLARGQPLELMIITAISLVVAAVPESLPAVVTLALALGARRMTARRAVVRRLPAVETLGAVTVIGT